MQNYYTNAIFQWYDKLFDDKTQTSDSLMHTSNACLGMLNKFKQTRSNKALTYLFSECQRGNIVTSSLSQTKAVIQGMGLLFPVTQVQT